MKTKRRNLVDGRKYHYTYRITNIKEGMYYYGVHSCDCLPKEDIGVKYWSTSKRDGFINHQKQNPEQYKYKVIKIFNTRIEAVQHEIFLHAKFDVKLHEKFYNDANQTSTGFDTFGKRGYSRPEHSERMKGANNPFFGKRHTEESKKLIRDNTDRSNAGNLIKLSRLEIVEDNKTLQEIITEKRLKTMTTPDENGETIYKKSGKKGGETRKLLGVNAGAKNCKANKINIYDESGNLQFQCNGNFSKICEEYDLPLVSLHKSYSNNGSPIFNFSRQSDITQMGDKYELYKGWFAIKII